MKSVKLGEGWEGKVENLLREAYYEGERSVIRGRKGSKAILVSPEDLDFLEKIETLLDEACYSGERIILKGTEGSKVAIVPLEDLELLEEYEASDSLEF
ncbi:MAG: hypothetical protein K1060chlam2_00805 [Chlamydiae bacterium]|nr:hypothetical protein [Chlamydiota bacterium]